MADTLDEVPVVELGDTFGQDFFVGPPPTSSDTNSDPSATTTTTGALSRPNPWASPTEEQKKLQLKQQKLRPLEDTQPTSTTGTNGESNHNSLTDPVPYTPCHPTQIKANLERAAALVAYSSNSRTTRGRTKIIKRSDNSMLATDLLTGSIIRPPVRSYTRGEPAAFSNPTTSTANFELVRPTLQPINLPTPQSMTLPQNNSPHVLNQTQSTMRPNGNPRLNWTRPGFEPRFAAAPNFTTFGNGAPRSRFVNPIRVPSGINLPPPAHSGLQYHISTPPPNIRPMTTPAQVGNFSSQAQPVRSALSDFLRQLQSSGVDINNLAQQFQSNNFSTNQPMDSATNFYNECLLNQQQQQQQQQPPLIPQMQNSGPTVFINNMTTGQSLLQQSGQPLPPPPPPKPVLPNEDDMAMQDKEVDADHDEEYHEIETYSDYTPAKLGFGHPHPDPVVETSSLSTVEPPDVTYTLKIPSKVISSAALSSLQLESVIYASQKHLQVMPDGKSRYGFLIGDGAGVGKGRTIAGVIYENYLCGRKKAIWLSVSTDLMHDAMRDLKDIGMDTRNFPVRGLKDFKYGKRITMDQGIIFITYSGLVSKSQSVKGNLGSRMGQLIAWVGSNFEGCLVFDECHKAKNIAFGDKKSKKQSKAAECVLEIQAKLPNARVVYASATGASETKHLGYMVRLGMWGPGTAYPTFQFFCEAIERRGVGAMELVAVDLKMRGSYIARQLSFKTTSFEIQYAPLTQQFIKLYDDCVDLWNLAFQHFREAEGYFIGDKKFTRTIWSLYWASHQKFFKYLCISAKVPVVVEIAKKALEDGKCVVIGLQSTGEAKTLEALEDGEINEFVSTAKATFESLIENHFPAPGRPKRPQRGNSEDSDLNYAAFGKSESRTNSGSSSSSTVDELYASDYSCKFVIQDGVALPVVAQPESSRRTRSSQGNQNTSTTARATRNKKALRDLIKTKKAAEKSKSTRALRAKRRATLKGGDKSRIKKADDSDSEDTEDSNPLSSCSSETARSPVSDDTYQDDDESESEDDTIYEESGSDDELAVIGTKAARKNNKKLIEDSDSDIEIMAIKPRKQHDVVMIASDEEEEDQQSAGPGVDRKEVEVDPFIKHGARLSQMRDELFEKVNALGPLLPNNTLDHLIDELGGPDQVAEMTGRKGRVVKDANGLVSYRQRNEVDTLDDMNIAEKDRFMTGKKLIAIISEAASSGISLQADKRVKNTRRRIHITIELPWSADRAIQQFGRTHRSNQLSGPEYIFVISELAGERRFASIVAKRLESLGALTHGDRRATSESRDLSQFNIASRYCKTALELIARLLECETRFADIQPVYPRGSFIRDARHAYVGVGLGKWVHRGIFVPEAIAINVNLFLNRILGMKVHIQNSLFKLFTDYTDRLIIRKKVSGQYDAGILELNSESGKAQVGQPEDFQLLTRSGKFLCTLRNVKVERGITWDAALAMYNNRNDDDERSGFYVSTNPLTKSKLVSLLIRNDIDQFRIYKPNTGKQPKPEFYGVITSKSETHKVSHGEAERIWNHVYTATDSRCIHLCFFNSCKRIEAKMKCDVGLRHRYYCILSGSILTAWPYLEKKVPDATKKINIVRIKLDVHNRVIGPIIPQDCLDRVRNALRLAEREGVDF